VIVADLARHGTKRVAKAVLIGAITPLMLKTAANPGGTRAGKRLAKGVGSVQPIMPRD